MWHLLVYCGLVFCVLVTLLVLSQILGPRLLTPTKEKPFECGGISFDKIEHIKVPISFYDVALAFLIFDIEVVFLLPLIWSFLDGNMFSAVVVILFLLVLTIGLIFELKESRFFKF
ncbi:MAG: NADH-quinone oxidoreductase subunit A [Deltaproteobacteria bacterium]|nr:NADH-quinone oxidoreductase subunit A [Deltaproteobacteria bacterium]